MSALRLRDRLGEIGVPTLVVGGDRDLTIGVDEILADYFALPEEARHLHIYHGIGHSPNVEVPASFSHLLARFIAEVNTGKAIHAVTR
jgi:pimeloyl-ACP methyl ester carboxylesterase